MGVLRRLAAVLVAPAPVDVDAGGLPFDALYPNRRPPAIARPATRPAAFRRVAASTSTVQLAIANPDRTNLILVNDSTGTLYVKHGPGASSTSYTMLVGAGATYILEPPDIYLGELTGAWAVGSSGTAVLTEP